MMRCTFVSSIYLKLVLLHVYFTWVSVVVCVDGFLLFASLVIFFIVLRYRCYRGILVLKSTFVHITYESLIGEMYEKRETFLWTELCLMNSCIYMFANVAIGISF